MMCQPRHLSSNYAPYCFTVSAIVRLWQKPFIRPLQTGRVCGVPCIFKNGPQRYNSFRKSYYMTSEKKFYSTTQQMRAHRSDVKNCIQLIPKSANIAIIGAGAAGLQAARQILNAGYKANVFEASDHVAGLWAYSATPSLSSPIYASLHSNIPKHAMTFERDEYPSHTPTFVSHQTVHNYLQSYARRHNLLPSVSFNSRVTALYKENSRWVVSVGEKSCAFDAVFMCVGHFSTPREWQVSGIKHLMSNGIDVRHSVLYRTSEGYEGKRVLVVGCGPSGVDISLELTNVASEVYVSHSKPSPVFALNPPSNLHEIGRIENILPNGELVTVDGLKISVDRVVSCTGYRRRYPFLRQGEAGVHITLDERIVLGLVRQCVAIQDPTLCFIGLPERAIPFPTFEAQIAFCIAVMQGRISHTQLKALIDEERKNPIDRSYHVLGKRQWDYICDLTKLAGQPPIPESVIEVSHDARKARAEDPQRYRNREYTILGDDSGNWNVNILRKDAECQPCQHDNFAHPPIPIVE